MDSQILQNAADNFGTPAYVFDLDAFALRIQYIKNILGERVKLYYAMKANPFFTQAAANAADGLEVCSPGEYAICRRAGVPSHKIVLSGVSKEAAHITAVMKEQGAHMFTVESLNQLQTLEQCARNENVHIRILLRLSSGNQFGMDEATVLSIIRNRHNCPHLEIEGLQYYSGTQKKNSDKLCKELLMLDRICMICRDELHYEIRQLEYGPGFHIPYFQGEQAVDENNLLADFKKSLDSLEFKGIIVLEAGRFLAAPCGSYVTRVTDIKTTLGQRYCIVDGGINHVNYYGQAMAMKIPAYRYLPQDGGRTDGTNREDERFTVCGSLCTAGDVLVKNLPLPGLKTGDLLVFDQIGAYSVTEGIYLFLSRNLPAVLTYTKTQGLRLVRSALPTDRLNSENQCCETQSCYD